MNCLLDTHVFLWWIFDENRLSQKAAAQIADPKTHLYWSAVSSWEISIKYHLGKLELNRPPQEIIPEQLGINQILSLPISDTHAFLVGSLPGVHKDPFDRMLAAQAISEGLTIISGDHIFQEYDVRILW